MQRPSPSRLLDEKYFMLNLICQVVNKYITYNANGLSKKIGQ